MLDFLKFVWQKTRAILSWIVTIPSFILHMFMTVVLSVLTLNNLNVNMYITQLFLYMVIWGCGIKVKGYGQENIPKKTGFVLMSNHQSQLDILVLFKKIPRPVHFIAKKELKYVPVLGWTMMIQRHFFIDRSNPRKAKKTLDYIKKKVKKGWPLVVFPEGTRSSDGKLGKFKTGPFKIALETGVPIIPCYIDGSRHILPKNKLLAGRTGNITVTFGQEIPVFNYQVSNKREEKEVVEKLMKKVRGEMVSLSKI